jgi:hypothetical protein
MNNPIRTRRWQQQPQPHIVGYAPRPPILLRQLGEYKWIPGQEMAAAIGKAVIVCTHYGVYSNGYATIFIAYPNGSRSTDRVTVVGDRLPKSITEICATREDIHNYEVKMGHI